ncbi:uncharacterized protein YneF (UPF0154 family) [Paenibacillus xylanexedens]|nr:uncharacterized protein YneF (UPF0154 family) [Paenibacillus xylanexedens]
MVRRKMIILLALSLAILIGGIGGVFLRMRARLTPILIL